MPAWLLLALAAPQQPVPAPASPPPAWEARTVVPGATEVKTGRVVVAAGDTLSAIADRTGASIEQIAQANGIEPPYRVRLGQRLTIPGGRYHRVGKGESGIAIARAYGVQWGRIADLNRLEEPYVLREGQRLLLPSSAETARMTMEQRAAAFRLDIEDLISGSEPAVAVNAKPAKAIKSAARPSVPPTVPVAEPPRFAGRFDWPLKGRILRPFGDLGDGRRNDGINIAADEGEAITAAADGVVAYAGTGIAVYGGLVLIRHGDGWLTAYGHAEELLVKRGQAVKRGQTIARAGETGSVSEPQLHFEVRQGRRPVNPATMLPAT